MFILSGSRLLHVVFLLATIVPICRAYKYFSEPQGLGLHHYDARYFRGRVSSENRAETLSELIVAFLDIMESEGIVAWAAHGTLLGWFWNGRTLPWYTKKTRITHRLTISGIGMLICKSTLLHCRLWQRSTMQQCGRLSLQMRL